MSDSAAVQAAKADDRRRWLAFAGVQLGYVTLFVDTGVMNLALVFILKDLQVSLSMGRWVVIGFTLATAITLLTAGRIADLVGRKPVLIAGFLLYAMGGVVAAAAPDFQLLVVARVGQGLAAALMSATVLALTTELFTAQERARALAIMSAVGAIGQVVGPMIGGQLLTWSSWRAVLLINVPLVLAAAVITGWLLKEPPALHGHVWQFFDWPGALLSMGTMGLLVMAFERFLDSRFDAISFGLLAGGVVLVVVFLLVERHARQPLLYLTLFRDRTFNCGAVAFGAVGLGGAAAMFLIPQYLQLVLGYGPAATGALVAPLPLAIAFAAPLAARFEHHMQARTVATGSVLATAIVLFGFSLITHQLGYAGIAVAMILLGVAMGVFNPANNLAALAAVAPAHLAIATAFLFTMNTLATFAGTSMSAGHLSRSLEPIGHFAAIEVLRDQPDQAAVLSDYLAGQAGAYRTAALVVFLAAVVTLFRGRRHAAAQPLAQTSGPLPQAE